MAKEKFLESSAFKIVMMFGVMVTLILGIFAVINTYQLKKFIIPEQLDVKKFLEKLNSHEEMSAYGDVSPLNVVQVNQGNLANLQSQIKDLDMSFVGDFIVQYSDILVVYNYKNDTIKGIISLSPFPADFFEKLNDNTEMKALKGQQPTGGGVLDEATLASLITQNPDAYKNAKPGDFVVVYGGQAVIYDYGKDKVVKVFTVKTTQ